MRDPAADAREPTLATHGSLVETILARARSQPDLPILRFYDDHGGLETFDCARLRDEAVRYGRALASAGIEAGDPVLLLFPASHRTVGAFLGAICLGAVPAIYPYAAAPGRAFSVAPIRRVVLGGGFRANATWPEMAGALQGAGCPIVGIPDSTMAQGGDFPFRVPADRDAAFVQLSSGTTGPSKAVVLSHGAITRYAASNDKMLGYRQDDVSVGWIPLFHDMGLVTHLLVPILTGVASVHISTAHWLRHPESLVRAVDRHRGTMTWMPNFAFRYCARRIRDEDLEGLDLSCWRIVGNGSEPILPEALEEFAERLAPAGLKREALMAGYGFAENVCGVTLTPVGRQPGVDWISLRDLEAERRAVPSAPRSPGSRGVVSCGAPRPGVEVRIVDAADRPVPERHVGRVLVRSDTLFTGYLGSPDLTRDSLVGDWFRSGDLGYAAGGELYVCGRESDVIIMGGRNVHPESIESAAATALEAAAGRLIAFGIRDDAAATEIPVLVCETKEQTKEERKRARRIVCDAVLADLGVRLADVHFVPKGWITRTTSGKGIRASCRRKYQAEGTDSVAVPARDLEGDVTRLFEGRLDVRPLRATDDLCVLTDSLQLASLLLEVEGLAGRRLPWEAFLREPTLARLSQILRSAGEDRAAMVESESPACEPDLTSPRGSRRSPQKRLQALMIRSVPYPIGVSVFRWSAGNRLLRAKLLGSEVALLLRFYALLERPAQDLDEFLERALVVELGRKLRDAKLARSRGNGIPRGTVVRGRSLLDEALAQERGVILLHSHFGPLLIAALVAGSANGRARVSVTNGEIDRLSSSAGRYEARLVDRILTARRTLEHGGIVDIAGDGFEGASMGMEFAFHGRRRTFRAGFAHLAETTGAAVITVVSAIDPWGRVEMEFGSLREPAGSTPDERIVDRVASYVGILEEIWRHDPANVHRSVMRKHLESPFA